MAIRFPCLSERLVEKELVVYVKTCSLYSFIVPRNHISFDYEGHEGVCFNLIDISQTVTCYEPCVDGLYASVKVALQELKSYVEVLFELVKLFLPLNHKFGCRSLIGMTPFRI